MVKLTCTRKKKWGRWGGGGKFLFENYPMTSVTGSQSRSRHEGGEDAGEEKEPEERIREKRERILSSVVSRHPLRAHPSVSSSATLPRPRGWPDVCSVRSVRLVYDVGIEANFAYGEGLATSGGEWEIRYNSGQCKLAGYVFLTCAGENGELAAVASRNQRHRRVGPGKLTCFPFSVLPAGHLS